MGGLAAVIDWGRPVAPRELDPLLALAPHRGTGGIRRVAREHAVLAESFFDQDAPDDPAAIRIGHLSIVGDLRLWNRDGLRSRAGGQSATRGMGDRRLLLEAYRRTGIDFLDDVDGDFAFIIWDDHERRLVAARDRFGVKPLFFERTPTGIRLASEVKQLAATSLSPIEPCTRSVVEYLTGQYSDTRFTFFEGIERIRPSMALVADQNARRDVRYWEPSPDSIPPIPPGDVSDGFRLRLVDSVRRRLDGSDVSVSHLTGGLDSSSITGAAHIVSEESQADCRLHTVSAVFPGHSNDESSWIAEIASQQPFPHHEFVPAVQTIDRFEADMWASDTPRPAPIDLWTGSIGAAKSVGADLVLTGYGGDEVLDQSNVLADLFRRGNLTRWVSGVRSYSSWSESPIGTVAGESIRGALPLSLKRSIRTLLGRPDLPRGSMVRKEAWESNLSRPAQRNPTAMGFASRTQNLTISFTRAPLLVQMLEYVETRHALSGLEVSAPFLDRTLVEYVASIPIAARPLETRTKTLARRGFSEWLPSSVVSLRRKTVADGYLVALMARLGPDFHSRFPDVPAAARPFIDHDRYRSTVSAVDDSSPTFEYNSLWSTWTLMTWLNGFGRYAIPSGRSLIT